MIFIALQVHITWAIGQSGSKNSISECPEVADVTQRAMLGEWRVEWQSPSETGSLVLSKNANYEGSFSGEAVRGEGAAAERVRVAGDVEDGDFTLEESADGRRISATWTGAVVEGSCGREIRGTWTAPARGWDAARSRAFVMSRGDTR